MRCAPTSSEALLWAALRGSHLGVAFRRQAVIGGYIVDFVAPSVRLIVEVDGGYHALRERRLQRFGYRILRFSADDVLRTLPEVIVTIARATRR